MQEEILRDLRSGALDAIVQVQMLGEGFDHPPLSVAAIFRPYPVAQPVHPVRRPGHARQRAERAGTTPTTRASSSHTSG